MQDLPIKPELRGVAALDNALAFITAHPERHEQGVWGEDTSLTFPHSVTGVTCNTQACVAGWIAVFAGAEITYTETGMMQANGTWPNDLAAEIIGLPEDEISFRPDGSDGLFHSDNTLADLFRLRELIADGTY